MRVAYTDYSNVALVYMCYAPEVLGTCDRNRVHVSLLSRSPSMSKAQRTILMSHIDLDCVENGHLHQATSGKELLKQWLNYINLTNKIRFWMIFCKYKDTREAIISERGITYVSPINPRLLKKRHVSQISKSINAHHHPPLPPS